MKLSSEQDAIDHIKKEHRYRTVAEFSPTENKGILHPSNFDGDPEVTLRQESKGRKVWKYHWPEEPGVSYFVVDDGAWFKEQDEADLDAYLEDKNA